jgi:hypothetical protein
MKKVTKKNPIKRNYRLYIYYLAGILIVIVIIAPLIKASVNVLLAPTVSDPVQFVKQFDPSTQPQVFPGHGEGFSIIGDSVGYAKSPLFPYLSIFEYRYLVNNCTPDYREIHVDPVWNVFFFRISSCHWPEQLNEKYFGPYKSKTSLKNLNGY